MGDDVIIPGPPGDNCAQCDNILWTPGSTPLFVQLTFKDIVPCPLAPLPPPNGSWVLRQDSVLPCLWEYYDSDWLISWALAAGSSEYSARGVSPGYNSIFFWNDVGNCLLTANNHHNVCLANVVGIGGSVINTLL